MIAALLSYPIAHLMVTHQALNMRKCDSSMFRGGGVVRAPIESRPSCEMFYSWVLKHIFTWIAWFKDLGAGACLKCRCVVEGATQENTFSSQELSKNFGDKVTIVVSRQLLCFFLLHPAAVQVTAAGWASSSECTWDEYDNVFLKQHLHPSLSRQKSARAQTVQ